MSNLHEIARLYVNFFQPSFKLKSKTREGAKVTKKYDTPAPPYQRLLASDRVTDECKEQLRPTFSTLDPVDLLKQIPQPQRTLADSGVGGDRKTASEAGRALSHFVKSLSTAWRDGEVRPTHRKHSGRRTWRTRLDPFEKVWPLVEQWLDEQIWQVFKQYELAGYVASQKAATRKQLRRLLYLN